MAASFAQIDGEFGPHSLPPPAYAIIRRIIHSTADFDYRTLVRFELEAIARGLAAIRERRPIVVDVTMVAQGIKTLLGQTFQNPLLSAVAQAERAEPGKTRTETGLLRCIERHPEAIYVVGNAPTALLALCEKIRSGQAQPALVVGAPVGFISVIESKMALRELSVPQIRVEGRKGGSPVAAAIVNALLMLACETA